MAYSIIINPCFERFLRGYDCRIDDVVNETIKKRFLFPVRAEDYCFNSGISIGYLFAQTCDRLIAKALEKDNHDEVVNITSFMSNILRKPSSAFVIINEDEVMNK